MSLRPNLHETYVSRTGQLTVEGMKVFQDMADRLEAAEAKLTAIAAVTAPSGGATIDSEARTAINNIISGAA